MFGVNASVRMIGILVLLTVVSSLETKKMIFNYQDQIIFTVFNNRWVYWILIIIALVLAFKSLSHLASLRTTGGKITTFDQKLSTNGCDPKGNFAIIVHGWNENIHTPWVKDTVNNLIKYRGGCVIFMDYSNFSTVSDYFILTPHFFKISRILLRKVRQIGNYDRLFMYGFSFGSRLCFEVGSQLGYRVIDRIDACDPAGPGFDHNKRYIDPKLAAKNVACINTSIDKGTNIYDCHQNFRMGKCGKSQIAAGPKPLGNHGLCPYFYNAAFTQNFTANNVYNCTSKRPAINIPENFTMGYRTNRT